MINNNMKNIKIENNLLNLNIYQNKTQKQKTIYTIVNTIIKKGKDSYNRNINI